MLHHRLPLFFKYCHCSRRLFSAQPQEVIGIVSEKRDIPATFELDGLRVNTDSTFNISQSLCNLFERRLLFDPLNPLFLLKKSIIDHFHSTYRKPGNRSPVFTICEQERRLVSVFDNFDSLMTPADHVSRRASDTYYVNADYCLRAHTSAHQFHLLKQGLDNFIVIGDVYRRDEIDRTHFPCFHQMEGVKTYSADELFGSRLLHTEQPQLFLTDNNKNNGRIRTSEKQELHTEDASKVLVIRLKEVLENLARTIFGPSIEYRWVDAYFPFTHPSFELEVFFNGQWLEVLGCGVMEQKLLESAGAGSKVGWAFGLGLERIAMALFDIPDIRLFWSRDTGFLNQFRDLKVEDYHNFKCKPISDYPQLKMDLSFWIPLLAEESNNESPELLKRLNNMKSDVRDVIRSVGGDLVEQVELIDEFYNGKARKYSHCYRIVYRSNEKVLTKEEINTVHHDIAKHLADRFGVVLR